MDRKFDTSVPHPATVAEINEAGARVHRSNIVLANAAWDLRDAANAIALQGWRSAPAADAHGPLSLIDALEVAAFGGLHRGAPAGSVPMDAYCAAHDAVHAIVNAGRANPQPVADWEHDNCRTREQAVEVLEAAAELIAPARRRTRPVEPAAYNHQISRWFA
jgi:hypothetical protein